MWLSAVNTTGPRLLIVAMGINPLVLHSLSNKWIVLSYYVFNCISLMTTHAELMTMIDVCGPTCHYAPFIGELSSHLFGTL